VGIQYQEDCSFGGPGLRQAMEIVISVAIEDRRLVLNAGVRDGVNWPECHDAMQAELDQADGLSQEMQSASTR
jgi:hypothetical protein